MVIRFPYREPPRRVGYERRIAELAEEVEKETNRAIKQQKYEDTFTYANRWNEHFHRRMDERAAEERLRRQSWQGPV